MLQNQNGKPSRKKGPRKKELSKPLRVVFFDLETTGFDRPIRPVQIGAVESWGQESFNQFLWPRRFVHPKARLMNHFFADTVKEKLFRYNKELEAVDLVEGLLLFMEWLEQLGGNIVLVAHKCLDYDAKVLLRNLEEFNIAYNFITGFSDSLLASRHLYTEVHSHKLSSMLEVVGLPVREEHDALKDAEDCRRICKRMARACQFSFIEFIFQVEWYHDLGQQWDWTFPTGEVTL